jgi:tripartite-type tricarboxylate transporter receptor subunit TctC
VTTSKRSHVLPQVPTVQESGVPGYDNSLWYGIFAAAGTPPAIVQRLNSEIVKAMGQPKSKEAIEGYGYQIVGSSPEQMDSLLRSEVVRWAKVVKDSGFKPN